MATRLSIFAWLVSLEALDTPPERQSALYAGQDLAGLAARDGLADGDAPDDHEVSRTLAELESDGWIAWDWMPHGGDLRPEQPPASMFDYQALQRVKNVRITPEGYAAFAARQRLESIPEAPGSAPAETAGVIGHRYDLFVCHASEDKEAVARPLARALQSRGFSVWFDEEQIEVGVSLRMTIEAGLATSRYGVVVLSQAFFDKDWPQNELNGLFAREIADGGDVILPLWHEIDGDFLAAKAPMMADRFALDTSSGIEEVAERLARRLSREQGREQLRARVPLPPTPPVASPSVAMQSATPSNDMTALEARNRVVTMLRAGDEIGLHELLRFERRAFEASVLQTLQRAGDELGSSAEPEHLKPIESALWSQVDRRLGSLLPLIEHQPAALDEEFASLLAFAARPTPTRSPYSAWVDGPRWPVWLVTLILGSVAVAFNRFEVVVAMWNERASFDSGRPLPVVRLRGAAELGAALLRARPAHVVSPAVELWYPAFAVSDSELLGSHYCEVMQGGDASDGALGFLSRAGDFLWLCGALAGRDDIEVIRFWSASQVHPTLRARLEHDQRLVERLAAALGVGATDLLALLDEWILTVPGRGL
jgi:hypothetical protein